MQKATEDLTNAMKTINDAVANWADVSKNLKDKKVSEAPSFNSQVEHLGTLSEKVAAKVTETLDKVTGA